MWNIQTWVSARKAEPPDGRFKMHYLCSSVFRAAFDQLPALLGKRQVWGGCAAVRALDTFPPVQLDSPTDEPAKTSPRSLSVSQPSWEAHAPGVRGPRGTVPARNLRSWERHEVGERNFNEGETEPERG